MLKEQLMTEQQWNEALMSKGLLSVCSFTFDSGDSIQVFYGYGREHAEATADWKRRFSKKYPFLSVKFPVN